MRAPPSVRLLLLLATLAASLPPTRAALPVESYELRRNKAYQLTDDQKSAEAEKALLVLLKERPTDGGVLFALGRVVMQYAHELEPGAPRRKLVKQMRDYFTRARAAGFNDPLIDGVLKETNPDGTEKIRALSDKKDLDRLLQEGEKYFGQRDYARALEKYAKVLELDPACYIAALYAGDALLAAGRAEEALEWFAKARTIDPDRETAHRYAGDALLRLQRPDEALPFFVSAAVAEPTNGYPWRTLHKFCQDHLIKPWTVPREIPAAGIKHTAKGDELALPEQFTALDMAYGVARLAWQKENRAKQFPAGTSYRLTLEEESSALRTTIQVYREMKQKPAEPADATATAVQKIALYLDQLVAIDDAGLLEAHILLVRGNEDLAKDYPAYRTAHRHQLHDYLTRFYLHLK